MSFFLIASQILVFFHIAFGEFAAASLLWATKELIYLKKDRLIWLRRTLWAAFLSVMMAWVVGGTYYLFFYPQVKPVIKEGPEAWGHSIVMESKEHIFLFLPVLLFLLALFVQRHGELLLDNPLLKRRFLYATLGSTVLIFSMAIMGYLITWSARSALWLNSGL